MRKAKGNTADPRATSQGFLPAEYVEHKTEGRFYAIVVVLFLIVMLAVAGAFVVTNQRWSDVREQQRTISTQYEDEASKLDQLRDLEGQRQEMLEKAEVTTALLEPVPRSVLMAELVTNLPEGVTLLQVKMESKRVREELPPPAAGAAKTKAKTKSLTGKEDSEPKKPKVQAPKFEYALTIVGASLENNFVADYLRGLKRSPLLANVELQYIAEERIDTGQYRKFEIVVEVRNDADARLVPDAEEVELADEYAAAKGG